MEKVLSHPDIDCRCPSNSPPRTKSGPKKLQKATGSQPDMMRYDIALPRCTPSRAKSNMLASRIVPRYVAVFRTAPPTDADRRQPIPDMLPTSNTATLVNAARSVQGSAHVINVMEIDPALATEWKAILASVGFNNAIRMVIMLAPWNIKAYFKQAIEHANHRFIFNGSKTAGHDNFSKAFKGAVLLEVSADAAKKTIGGMLTALGVNHVFDDKPHKKELYLHPRVVPELLDELGVPYSKVLQWREANLTPEQLEPINRYERADYTPEPATVVRTANIATPAANQSDAVAVLEGRRAALTEQLTSVIQGAAGTSGTAGRRQLTEASVPDTSAASTADSPPAQATPPAKRARA